MNDIVAHSCDIRDLTSYSTEIIARAFKIKRVTHIYISFLFSFDFNCFAPLLIVIDNYDAIWERSHYLRAKVSEEWRLLEDICLASTWMLLFLSCASLLGRKRCCTNTQFTQSTNIHIFPNENACGHHCYVNGRADTLTPDNSFI